MSKILEIVNKEIELIHNQLNDYDEEDEEYGFYPSYDTLMYELNNYNQIKQDLEILEIFKALMFHNIKSIGFKSSIKNYEALFNMGIITKEQLDKLKQWLEVNDDERD